MDNILACWTEPLSASYLEPFPFSQYTQQLAHLDDLNAVNNLINTADKKKWYLTILTWIDFRQVIRVQLFIQMIQTHNKIFTMLNQESNGYPQSMGLYQSNNNSPHGLIPQYRDEKIWFDFTDQISPRGSSLLSQAFVYADANPYADPIIELILQSDLIDIKKEISYGRGFSSILERVLTQFTPPSLSLLQHITQKLINRSWTDPTGDLAMTLCETIFSTPNPLIADHLLTVFPSLLPRLSKYINTILNYESISQSSLQFQTLYVLESKFNIVLPKFNDFDQSPFTKLQLDFFCYERPGSPLITWFYNYTKFSQLIQYELMSFLSKLIGVAQDVDAAMPARMKTIVTTANRLLGHIHHLHTEFNITPLNPWAASVLVMYSFVIDQNKFIICDSNNHLVQHDPLEDENISTILIIDIPMQCGASEMIKLFLTQFTKFYSDNDQKDINNDTVRHNPFLQERISLQLSQSSKVISQAIELICNHDIVKNSNPNVYLPRSYRAVSAYTTQHIPSSHTLKMYLDLLLTQSDRPIFFDFGPSMIPNPAHIPILLHYGFNPLYRHPSSWQQDHRFPYAGHTIITAFASLNLSSQNGGNGGTSSDKPDRKLPHHVIYTRACLETNHVYFQDHLIENTSIDANPITHQEEKSVIQTTDKVFEAYLVENDSDAIALSHLCIGLVDLLLSGVEHDWMYDELPLHNIKRKP